jgi:hypothetical protein
MDLRDLTLKSKHSSVASYWILQRTSLQCNILTICSALINSGIYSRSEPEGAGIIERKLLSNQNYQ